MPSTRAFHPLLLQVNYSLFLKYNIPFWLGFILCNLSGDGKQGKTRSGERGKEWVNLLDFVTYRERAYHIA